MNELTAQSQNSIKQQDLTLLKVYTFYRTILASLFLLTFAAIPASPLVGDLKPVLFIYVTSAYFFVNLLVLLIVLPKKISLNNRQQFANFLFDIAAIILIADATGGISSGLGILLVISIAASSIIFKNQLATLLAAIASIAILVDTARLIGQGHLDTSSFLPSGVLGIILLITSFFIQNLAQRIRRAQQIAEQSTAELNTLQQLNQLIVQRMRTGILVVDDAGQIQMNNAAATELLGISNANNNAVLTLPDILYKQLKQWLNSPQYHTPPFRGTETGPELQASFSHLTENNRCDVLIFLEDNRQLAQRAQQMKLASLGRLTASIAHEIRNPLSAINHGAQLLEESPTIHPDDRRLCEIIQHHAARMNKIVENVLQLSQRHAPNPERIKLHDWLRQFIADFQCTEYPDKTIKLSNDPQAPEVTVDISQLSQVLTNLVQNALRHSYQHTGKATVSLDIHVNQLTLLPVLDIIDQGPGITKHDTDKIFEPFYTTQTTGTGLGLYISRELCEANQSRLDYVRTENNASCFRISFAHPDRRLAPD